MTVKVQVTVSDELYSEEYMLKRWKDDWSYIRKSRSTKPHFAFHNPPSMEFFIATITSPEEYAGKIAGYSGIGEYSDLLVDSGTYVLGGKALSKSKGTINLRAQGISYKLRSKRTDLIIEKSNATNKPAIIILNNSESTYSGHLIDINFQPLHEGIPPWALTKVKNKYWLVYNPNDEPMKKAWEILKI